MKNITSVVMLLCIMTLTGCVRNEGLHGANKEVWKNKNILKDHDEIESNKALVSFYRIDNQAEGKTINIFVNKQYLTSLEPNAMKKIKLCSGNNNFTAYKTDVSERYNTKLNKLDNKFLDAGKSYAFLVTETNGNISLTPMTEKELNDFKGKVSEQVHTLPRVDVAQRCQ
ncbi:cell envelope biogenesis protein OmpA [Proteus mirabilis]|uniref:cell envelope biogenesis protein OmpA n=1 Tax=Proteus mirabilis TaxID=584 RepID=UPI0018C723A5|nr:cell envelope biogenesis protein OmpA [Proteus mirabilis]EKT9691932.1 cell envelope biogenesis protein OmpA [Proteus mirabilis]EKX9511949.1 cell envelope biogenesis protein OmpA [Proteus mirabilis]MBG2746555.1 cell envelope biogenesis protein OmpA [Proteus mirabilis]MBI6487443.1 cell envelope biogenesis protein OmpA [Proteus mirabilis]MBN7150824.1 cell envelope biogenesis protein OmpA [Proteus mirabilis]